MTSDCFPIRLDPAAGRKFRVLCNCGEVSTPRANVNAARAAFECEHGWTAGLYVLGDPIPTSERQR